MKLPDETTAIALAAILDATERFVAARVIVLDQNEKPIGSSVPVIAGSVSVDAGADVTRSAELHAIDPNRALGFDAGSPGLGSLYADRFVEIAYGVADVSRVVAWTPIFRGPVVRFDRSHPEVTISAQGKESLGLAPNLPLFQTQAVNIPKGTRVDTALRRIAAAMGESSSRLSIPQIPARLKERIALGRTSEPWKVLRKVAKEHGGYQAFYDGRGILRVRKTPPRPVWRFDGELLTFPTVTYDLGGDFRNVVRVVGKPKSGKNAKPPSYTALPPPADPLSPRSLARGGVPRSIAEYLEVEETEAPKVRHIAELELARRMRQSVAITFEALTVPGLEEGDPVEVVLPGEGSALAFSAETFSIALGVDQMSIGQTKTVHVRKTARS
jgi:hypothetical protein